jgi:hypothetical protein
MVITMKELAINFNHLDYNTLLKDWQWLIGSSKLPILLTAAGDAFVQDAKGGPIHFLDVGKRELNTVAGNDNELHSLLTSKDFVANHFATENVRALIQAGMRLRPGQIYSFKVLPILGGQCTPENVEMSEIASHFSLVGQIHQKIKGLPANG